MFIVLEGLEGSGKSTQARLLSEQLTAANIPNLNTRQPTASPIGAMAREFTQGKFGNLQNETVGLLFAADRFQHFTHEIAPALLLGQFVVCDRYYYSNMAYQGVDDAVLERIVDYNQAVRNAKIPDVTFFLDVTPDECIRRITATRDEISIYDTLSNLEQLRERYFATFRRLEKSDNIVIVTTDGLNEVEVCNKIWGELASITGDKI